MSCDLGQTSGGEEVWRPPEQAGTVVVSELRLGGAPGGLGWFRCHGDCVRYGKAIAAGAVVVRRDL
jgi:hypothetical protein